MSETLKAQILELIGGDEEDAATVNFALMCRQYQNLVLDEMVIGKITEEDRKFLEEKFTGCEMLGLNDTKLESLDNLPNIPGIARVSRV